MACWLETAQHLKCPDGGIDARDFGARTTLNQTRVKDKPGGGRLWARSSAPCSSARAKTLPTIRNSKQLLFSLQFRKRPAIAPD
jgi:hypothetical protein